MSRIYIERVDQRNPGFRLNYKEVDIRKSCSTHIYDLVPCNVILGNKYIHLGDGSVPNSSHPRYRIRKTIFDSKIIVVVVTSTSYLQTI